MGTEDLNLWPMKGCKLCILQLAYLNTIILLENSILHTYIAVYRWYIVSLEI